MSIFLALPSATTPAPTPSVPATTALPPITSPVPTGTQIIYNNPDIHTAGTSYWVPLATIGAALLGAVVLYWNEIRKSKREDARKVLELDRQDRRHWHREIRQVYVDASAVVKQLEQLDLRNTHRSEEEMKDGKAFFNRSAQNMEENRLKNPKVYELSHQFPTVIADAEIIADASMLAVLNELNDLLHKIAVNTHDGLYYPAFTEQIEKLHNDLRDATRQAIWGNSIDAD